MGTINHLMDYFDFITITLFLLVCSSPTTSFLKNSVIHSLDVDSLLRILFLYILFLWDVVERANGSLLFCFQCIGHTYQLKPSLKFHIEEILLYHNLANCVYDGYFRLQNPQNKREILCDEKLKAIFEGKNAVGFLEIGKLLSPHFVKSA